MSCYCTDSMKLFKSHALLALIPIPFVDSLPQNAERVVPVAPPQGLPPLDDIIANAKGRPGGACVRCTPKALVDNQYSKMLHTTVCRSLLRARPQSRLPTVRQLRRHIRLILVTTRADRHAQLRRSTTHNPGCFCSHLRPQCLEQPDEVQQRMQIRRQRRWTYATARCRQPGRRCDN